MFAVGMGAVTVRHLTVVVALLASLMGGCQRSALPGEGGADRQSTEHIDTQVGLELAALLLEPSSDQELRNFYAARAHAPAWVVAGRLSASGAQVLDALGEADTWGLRPHDYGASGLRAEIGRLVEAEPVSARRIADVDLRLTTALMRFLTHVHVGRLDPRTLGYDYRFAAERLDHAALLAAATGGQLTPSVASLEPQSSQYHRLKDALARYRVLARKPHVNLAPIATRLKPGDDYRSLRELREWLVHLGDLPADVPVNSDDRYGGPVVEAVARFQARHGLDPDGVIGRATAAGLATPLPHRVVQIELALERLRWLPIAPGGRMVVANIPEFQLHAYERAQDAEPRLSMRIIIGRAAGAETPLFAALMQYLVFRPYWYPPASIITREILPALAIDPAYLEANDMEIVASDRDDAAPLSATPENLRLLRAGARTLRQRPGPKNALGGAKFIFPNAYHTYMHDTPARSLFSRARRDFSHGCIRVADPAALAEFVLGGQSEWTPTRIRAAMSGGESVQVTLAVPVPVLILYATARVREDGAVMFFDDIYGHDATLRAALSTP